LILEPNGPSFVSQKYTGGEKTEFIECKASTLIPSKSALADNGEKVSEDSSIADTAVCENEQFPSDDEEINLDGARLVECSEKLRTLQEDTSNERGTNATADKSHMNQPCAYKAQRRQTCGCKCCKDPKTKVGTSRCATGLQ